MREKILKPNEFIEAFDSGVEINEQTLLNYAYSGEVIEEGENRRWSRTVTSIAKINGRYFKILWEEGLTEYQDNSVWDAPIEVNKLEYDKIVPEHTVHIVEWVEKSNM